MTPGVGQASCIWCDSVYAEGEEHDCEERAAAVRRARTADDFTPCRETGARAQPPVASEPVSRRSPSSPGPAPSEVSKTTLARIDTSGARHHAQPQGERRGTRRRDDARQQAEGAGGAVVCAAPPAPVGIRSARVESWEEHLEAWHHFGRQIEGGMWGRAAVAASLRGRYGEAAIEKFATEVGQSRSTVYRLAQIHDAYPEESRRRDNLSYWHHVEALKAPDPVAALAEAEAEGLSVRALRAKLAPPKPKAAAPALPSEPKPATSIVDVVEAQQRQPSVDESDPEDIARELIERLGPLTARDVADEIRRQLDNP